MPSTPTAQSPSPMQRAHAQQSAALSGTVRAPGDKSISHRAMIFGALAQGRTTISGLLEGADIMSTTDAMRAFGAEITRADDGIWTVHGRGDAGWSSPTSPVDCGNAGTGVRLIMGAAAGQGVGATFIGDASLTSRPMGRITGPLGQMGASFDTAEGARLPAILHPTEDLKAITYQPEHASAQVKSAILLAGLGAQGTTTIIEPIPTRDHTENMLRAFGVTVEARPHTAGGAQISVNGGQNLQATHVNVPGDPSSAAFLIVAALITPGSDLIVENVMMNPTRTGLFECLTEMGGYLRADNFRKSGGEVIADFHVKYSKLSGITVPPERAASMTDEYPVLSVAAAFASGTTIMDEIGELRVKESDRISATYALLADNGVDVTELENGLRVTGQKDGTVKGGAVVTTHHDHRIAMSALILGLRAKDKVQIDDASMIATSFPSFFDLMGEIGANITLDAAQ